MVYASNNLDNQMNSRTWDHIKKYLSRHNHKLYNLINCNKLQNCKNIIMLGVLLKLFGAAASAPQITSLNRKKKIDSSTFIIKGKQQNPENKLSCSRKRDFNLEPRWVTKPSILFSYCQTKTELVIFLPVIYLQHKSLELCKT